MTPEQFEVLCKLILASAMWQRNPDYWNECVAEAYKALVKDEADV